MGKMEKKKKINVENSGPLKGELSLKKNRKIWEKFPNGGGGDFFSLKKVPISIWELRKSRGGLNFSKMSE